MMNLTLRDRVLILNFVLPEFDSREKMALKLSISKKIAISDSDWLRIVTKDMGGGKFSIGFTDVEAITDTKDVSVTDAELMYIKQLVDCIDKNGMFSAFNFETYTRLLETPFENPDYQALWEKMIAPVVPYQEFVPSPLPAEEQPEPPVDPNVITEKHIDLIEE